MFAGAGMFALRSGMFALETIGDKHILELRNWDGLQIQRHNPSAETLSFALLIVCRQYCLPPRRSNAAARPARRHCR